MNSSNIYPNNVNASCQIFVNNTTNQPAQAQIENSQQHQIFTSGVFTNTVNPVTESFKKELNNAKYCEQKLLDVRDLELANPKTSEEFQKTVALLKMESEKGDPRALYNLGYIYEKENPELSFSYYKNASDLGHFIGAFKCGLYLENSNPKDAAFHFEKAVQRDFLKKESFFRLGHVYEKFDTRKSLINYKKAAEQHNHVGGFIGLKNYFERAFSKSIEALNLNVPVESIFIIANEQEEQTFLQIINDENGQVLASFPETDELIKKLHDMQALVCVYSNQVVNLNNDRDCQYKVGQMFKYGCNTPKNITQARNRFQLAADNNHVLAQYEVGMIHGWGYMQENLLPNVPLAIYYLTLALGQGCDKALAPLNNLNNM